MSRRTLKLIGVGYVLKTIVFGVAWLMIPDLPQRALDTVRATWEWVAGAE